MTNQETKELLHKLIVRYKQYILAVAKEKEVVDAKKILNELDTHIGICACSRWIFHENICNEKWMEDLCDYGSVYWAPTPGGWRVSSISEMITHLQTRLNKLLIVLLDQTYITND